MSTSGSPERPRRAGRLGALVATGALVLAGGAYGVGYALSGQTLPPNATIEGVRVGGLSPADAEERLRAELGPRAEAPLSLTAGEQAVAKPAAELGLGVDWAASVARAGGERSANPIDVWESLTGGGAHDAVVTRDEAKLDAAASELAQQVNADPENAELAIEKGAPRVVEGKEGRALDVAATKDALAAAYLEADAAQAAVTTVEPDITTPEAQDAQQKVAAPALSGPVPLKAGDKTLTVPAAAVAESLTFAPADGVLKATLDPAKLAKASAPALKALGLDEPQDASWTIRDGKPALVESQDGVGVAKDQLAKVVGEAMVKSGDQRAGTVDVVPLKAEYTTEQARNAGVKEVTGEFTTTFPATAYRINNIGKSAGLVNGVYLKPGDVFSMNEVLGPRTLANGWQAGGAIDGGKVVERMGGGISQTTTTTFNAIFFAGLEDVVHKPHSLYFDRYPMGREATLDYNSVEMKFRNNTDYGVLMQAYTNNPPVGGQGTVTVKVWSTKTYDVKASDPVVSNRKQPGPAIQSDAAVCSPQSPKEGFTVDYKRLFYKDGALVRSEPFRWTYNSLAQVTCTNPNAKADRIER